MTAAPDDDWMTPEARAEVLQAWLDASRARNRFDPVTGPRSGLSAAAAIQDGPLLAAYVTEATTFDFDSVQNWGGEDFGATYRTAGQAWKASHGADYYQLSRAALALLSAVHLFRFNLVWRAAATLCCGHGRPWQRPADNAGLAAMGQVILV